MAFTLTHIRTGDQHPHTLRDILEFLGDPVNDEIIIHGETYRISSVQGDLTNSNSGSVNLDWMKVSIPTSGMQNGQNIFTISQTFTDPEGLFLVVNGSLFDCGVNGAFHVEGHTLYWHGPFALDPNDVVYLKYLTAN